MKTGISADAIARRQAIVDAATKLFATAGYHATSMDDLAAAVGLAKPTVYHYYRGKAEILGDIHESFIRRVISKHEARMVIVSSPKLQLLGIIQDIFEFIEENASHVRVFYEQQQYLAPAKRDVIHELRTQYTQMVEAVITRGIEVGEIADVNPALASRAVFGMCNWSYHWFRTGEYGSGSDVASFMWNIVMSGLSGGGAEQGAPKVRAARSSKATTAKR
jgi:AcrR family transcriptional regulator